MLGSPTLGVGDSYTTERKRPVARYLDALKLNRSGNVAKAFRITLARQAQCFVRAVAHNCDLNHKHLASSSLQRSYEHRECVSTSIYAPISQVLADSHYRFASCSLLEWPRQMNPKWNGQFSCFDLVAKTDAHSRSVVRVRDIEIGGSDFVVMAGPCAVESETQLLQTAEAVAEAGARVLRGGAYKPRSSPYAFQGLGVEGLKILSKAREVTGLAIVTEVMSEEDVELIAEYADIMQVGTRSMENYALLEALGGCGRPVLLKRGMTATIEELMRSAQVIAMSGNPNVILCERGIRTFETATRNTLDIAAVPVLKAVSHLPVIVDPSHAAGVRSLVPVLSRAASVVGADGLIVEVHPCPEKALSDGIQSLNFGEFRQMMFDLQPFLDLVQADRQFRPELLAARGAD